MPDGWDIAGSEPIICFASGTRILTPAGARPVEALAPGDLVITLDRGPQPVRWVGRKTVRATGALAPVCFAAGTMGNARDLRVSPMHRMVCGPGQALAAARDLVDHDRVTVAWGGMVSYLHLLFDRHEVIFAEGAPSESFHPAGFALETLMPGAREALFGVFPALRADPGSYGPASRPVLSRAEVAGLV